MNRVVLCTTNEGKLAELRALLPTELDLISLTDVNIGQELPETGGTLEQNALQKARDAHHLSGLPCLADDTGLEVVSLAGAPGVLSARYAGPQRDMLANIRLLLAQLSGVSDRRARFRTVLALVDGRQERLWEGVVEGHITEAPQGYGGFGYDPVFIPLGIGRTFAEMTIAEKNQLSHRAMAIERFLKELFPGHLY